jgi:flavin reductase (DIM6/NTAB) family NADH-FMN oxidoreductase RutF
MLFDLSAVSGDVRYKLLAGVVTPRPIAWVTTVAPDGSFNAAPYSFFNVMGHSPPLVVLGFLADAAKGLKDTARHILGGSDFVINLTPESLASKMNETSIDAPAGLDELRLAGIETLPSSLVNAPRILGCPAALECTLYKTVEAGHGQTVVLGQVLAIHVDSDLVKDAKRGHLDAERLHPVGRLFGSNYCRTLDVFSLKRPSWADRAQHDETAKE